MYTMKNSSRVAFLVLGSYLLATSAFVIPSKSPTKSKNPSSLNNIGLSKYQSIESSLFAVQPEGCAGTPLDKKKIVVVGQGGYMGSIIFGFLQRATSLYKTGIGGVRGLCATAAGLESLNKNLLRCFRLAFAGEYQVRLTNFYGDSDLIAKNLGGHDAVIVGTVNELEKRPVTLNTYNKSPNDKTFEIYLDERYGERWVIPDDVDSVHLDLFNNIVEACAKAGIQHMVVTETPSTDDSKPYLDILEKHGVPYTYIVAKGQWEKSDGYSFANGLQADYFIQQLSGAPDNWTGDLMGSGKESTEPMPREDIATLAVQSLLSLDWKKSRCLVMSRKGDLADPADPNARWTDREWCANSNKFAEKLSSV